MIAKITVSGIILFAATVVLAAPASADPLFDEFSCTCGAPSQLANSTSTDRIAQGILDAETRQLP